MSIWLTWPTTIGAANVRVGRTSRRAAANRDMARDCPDPPDAAQCVSVKLWRQSDRAIVPLGPSVASAGWRAQRRCVLLSAPFQFLFDVSGGGTGNLRAELENGYRTPRAAL